MTECPACDAVVPALAFLQARAVDWSAGVPERTGRNRWRYPLCPACLAWLTSVVDGSAEGHPDAAVLAAPSTEGRRLRFLDQCNVCRSTLAPRTGAVVESLPAAGVPGPWRARLVCIPCEGWIANLATDARSVRGSTSRALDGEYGRTVHRRLSSLTFEVNAGSSAADEALIDACTSLGVQQAQGGVPAVRFLDAGRPAGARARMRGPLVQTVILAPYGAYEGVAAHFAAGAFEWVTLPFTPHLVAAVLSRLVEPPMAPLYRDADSLLPVLQPIEPFPAAAHVRPALGVTPFDAAWLVRRFARGYDDLGVVSGRIIFVPRVPAHSFNTAIARLNRNLSGRATLVPLARQSPFERFEAAG
jgi:hypothetical protein